MRNIARLLYTLLWFVHTTALHAETPEFIVEHYTMDQGISSNTVYCAHKGSDGFLWFGTWHGLCSFDGFQFTPFITRSSNQSAIPPRKVRNMVEDSNGNIWVRNTDNHLFLFNKKTESFHDVYDLLKVHSRNVQVIKIQKIANGRVLILTRSKDLFEAYTDPTGKMVLNKIYSSADNIDNSSLKLKRNVLKETSQYIFWLDKDLRTYTIVKANKARIIPVLREEEEFTAYNREGKYLCVGTSKGNIFVMDLNTGKLLRKLYSQGHQAVSTVNLCEGNLYYTTSEALYCINPSGVCTQVCKEAAHTTHSFTDKENKLWLYHAGKRLVYYNPTDGSSSTYALPKDSMFAEMKFKDTPANGLFILLRNGEVWHYNRKARSMESINKMETIKEGGAPPHFFDIDTSTDDMLWLSSTNNGVYKISFPKRNFKFVFPETLDASSTTESNDGIRAIYQSRQGDLWIANRRGRLYCYNLQTMQLKHLFEKEQVGVVYHIMEDDKGNLWFSTKGSGLVKATVDELSPEGLRLTRYKNSSTNRQSLSSNRVYYSFQDSKKRIWVCTFYGGLNLMEEHGGKVIFRNKRNGFKHYPHYELYTDVRAITEDRNGRLWVGTTDGLMSFDGNFDKTEDIRFEIYREQVGTNITENDIYTLYKDHRGDIWMGIFGNGLNRLTGYDAKKRQPVFTTYSINERQGGDVITSIIEDRNNNLWICTETGLAGKQNGTEYIKSYDKFSGWPQVKLEDNTSVCLQDGRVMVGTRAGILMFDPKTVVSGSNQHYPCFVTDFKVANQALWNFDPAIYEGSVKYADIITLKHNMQNFSVEFSSPYFSDNNPLPFAYILEGYETTWHHGTARMASYANVPPGKYTFKVKVDDGKSPEKAMVIRILPPWWSTWWAIAVYCILSIMALYGIARLASYMIKIRNEVYVNDRLAELKIRFFTNVSHELRTPLSLIHGPIEELKNSEHLSSSGKEYLDLIDRNARKMLQLVNQILDFRKIQNGKMKLKVSLVDLNAVIEMLMNDFKMLAEERHISFSFEKPKEHVMLWCDAEKIGMVINNLISNAFKYTEEGGTICVAITASDSNTCTIRVEDNGASIPEEQINAIFERFYQAYDKNSGDNKPAGTGIGLSLSKEYVLMHHGKIWAENCKKGKGVFFIVELPTGREHFNNADVEVYLDDDTAGMTPQQTEQYATTQQTEEAQSDKDERSTILLVEDNIDMCRMLQIQLGEQFNVYTAHEGNEGLKKTYQYHPDIIITDLMMPGMNGMELLHSIRQDFSISHIPVIILTAKNTDEDKLAAIKEGANAYIAKPFSKSYLLARIEQLLEEQHIFQRKMVVQNVLESGTVNSEDEYEQHLVKKDIKFVHDIHTIIENNLNTNDFNIDTIADTIGLSRSAFFKKLKSLTGFAPVDLVREIRLNKAAKLIENSDESISEIAYSVGFRDAGYFGKCFRKKYGMTPKEYRRSKTDIVQNTNDASL